jgi:type VI secretion system secreted protein VgrG
VTVEAAALSTPSFGTVRVVHLEGAEGMNRLSDWTLVIDAPDPEIDLAAALGESATLAFGDDDGFGRAVPLMLIDAAYVGPTRDGHRYDLRLSDPTWLMTQRCGTRAFIDEDAGHIVEAMLEGVGLTKDAQLWRMSEALQRRPQCVQYGESEWAFLTRMLADEGVSLWHSADEDGAPTITFSDHAAAHDPIAGDGALVFDDASGMSHSASSFFSFHRTQRLAPEAVHVLDYDVERPDVAIEGQAGEGPLEWFEYPAWVPDGEGAERRAARRLEQLRNRAEVAEGESHSARLVPGRTVKVSGTGDDLLDGAYLVTGVSHRLTQPLDETDPVPYRARASMVPYDGERAHRPAPPTSWPRIEGIESAEVAGPAGEEIHVDRLGAVKIRSPWDRSGLTDDRASCWARTLQLDMDGSMLLPRMGWEVAVAYRDGRPDQPLVLGKLYNPVSAVPYALPENKATASLMSGTSPNDGSVNEIRTVDDTGKQQFAVQASGDQSIVVGGNLHTAVIANEIYEVKGNCTATIHGTQSITVGGNQKVDVGAGCSTKVAGGRSVSVGSETINVTKNRALTIGSTCSQAVGGLYFVRCNNLADNYKGDFCQVVGGLSLYAAGAGVNEQVLGARTEICAERLIVAAQCEDKVYGGKVIVCGPSVYAIGGNLTTKASASAGFTAAATRLAGSVMVINGGSKVTINAAAFSAGAVNMGGAISIGGDLICDGASTKLPDVTNVKG